MDHILVKSLKTNLNNENILFSELLIEESEPSYDYLEKIRTMLPRSTDLIIAIGGGSAIDCAKAISLLLVNLESALSYRGFNLAPNKGAPIIAIPSTAGTGSEITPYAVFTDHKSDRKLGINSDHYVPKKVFLDPRIIVTCPLKVQVSSGLDALNHIVESFAAKNSNAITKMICEIAFEKMFNALINIKSENDLDNCTQLQISSMIGTSAFMNSGGGPGTALSYPLGVNFGVPHGEASGFFLPRFVKKNIEHGYTDYSELNERLLYLSQSNKFFFDISENLGDNLFKLCEYLDIPDNINHYGVKAEDYKKLVIQTQDFMAPQLAQNPVIYSEKDLYDIIQM